jgi:hypothetical protein
MNRKHNMHSPYEAGVIRIPNTEALDVTAAVRTAVCVHACEARAERLP